MTERIVAQAQRLAPSDDNRRWWTLGAMCFALFMIMLDNTVVNVALPSIQRDLHTTLSGLEWTINAYTLVFAVLLVTAGRLGDVFGRRRMFIFGVVTFALSSAAIGAAPTATWLVAGRAVQGIGAAFMMPATLSIITNAFPAHERGKAIGTWAGVSAIALAIGPMLGGYLVGHVSWRAIFYINLPVAALAVIVTLFATRESRDDTAPRSVDVPGVAALTVGIGALVYALVEGNKWGWGSGRIVGLFVLAGIALAAFVVIERRVKLPMIDFSYFRSRSFLGANLAAFTVSFAMFGMFLFLALYFQNILHYSPFQAGLRFLPATVVIMVLGPIAGRLADRVGPRPLITFGLVVVSASLVWQSFIKVNTSYAFLWPAFLLMGIGMAFVMSPMSTAAMNAIDRTKAGAASGVLSMTRMVGGTFGVAVIGALISGLGRTQLDKHLPGVPAGVRSHLADTLGAGGAAGGAHSPQITDALRHAYVYGLGHSLRVSAALALVGALLAWVFVTRDAEVKPELDAEGITAAAQAPARTEPAAPAERSGEPVSV
ncbi:MAG TPA: MFS transporter [Solirubrobacteraceae bacterium]|nr:MFS transporter [Solirubrobacteraceae bacterium]